MTAGRAGPSSATRSRYGRSSGVTTETPHDAFFISELRDWKLWYTPRTVKFRRATALLATLTVLTCCTQYFGAMDLRDLQGDPASRLRMPGADQLAHTSPKTAS